MLEKEENNRITVFPRVFLLSESFVDHAVSTIMHGFCGPERRCSGALRPVRIRIERSMYGLGLWSRLKAKLLILYAPGEVVPP